MRILAVLNNIGVAAEIVGMLVFALILLFFANHQSPSILFDTSTTSGLAGGNFFAVFLVGMLMPLFVVYGFDTAGTFGEETVDASRRAPRGVLAAIWLSGIVGAVFLLAVTLSFQDLGAATTSAQNFGFPIADTLTQNLTFVIFNGFTFGQLYLVVILIAVFVCTLAIQGATVRLLFSMGRDRRVPLGGVWAHVNPTLKTPANAGIAVGVLAAIPVLVTGAGGAAVLAISATGLIYLAYFMCNLGVLFARRRGWPHQAAPFSLRRLRHDHQRHRPHLGRRDDHQLRPLDGPRPLRHLRQRPAQHVDQPVHQHVPQVLRQPPDRPAVDPRLRGDPGRHRRLRSDLLPRRRCAARWT